jgi:hypothetical protein
MLYRVSAGAAQPVLKKTNGSVFSDVGPNPVNANSGFPDCTQMVLDSANRPVVYIRYDGSNRGGVFVLE